jgi:low temperature requirement protein LtrA
MPFSETFLVMLELPIMLALSWIASSWLISRFNVPARLPSRLVMGGMAFALLMAAEICVSMFESGRSLSGHLAHYHYMPAMLGLAGQLAFAAFPATSLAARRQ